MLMKRLGKKIIGLTMAAVICAGISTPAMAQTYNDFEYITSHINLKVPSGLTITRPTNDFTTSASTYFITGGSDPAQELTMNGEPVNIRGARGSFGVFVQLQAGENVFVFKQGNTKKSITITRGQSSTVTTTKVISKMAPSFDCATVSGNTINLSCVAPSGASVVATVGGRSVEMKQQAATAVAGVPATFTAQITAGNVNGTQNIGPVTYTLNGKTAYQSAGSVFITGKNSQLVVRVKNNAASVYQDEAKSAYLEVAKLGGTDAVTTIGSAMYQLASGGWIPKDSVQPLSQTPKINNKTDGISFTKDTEGEKIFLSGAGSPMFRAFHDSERLYVKLFGTTISKNLAEDLNAEIADASGLFYGADITVEDGNTIFSFPLTGKRALWGYDIRYTDGGTAIYAKYKPRPQNGGLSGITVMIDAGHGGDDPGALGIAYLSGATEKEINLASAIALQKRLESLGATVVMARTGDTNPSMNERMTLAQNEYVDFYISLHSNSIGYEQDANGPSGTEVYYYYGISKGLASAVASNISNYTGRKPRGAKHSIYRVTMNSFAPCILVEMGFLTNPVEYDSMTSRKGIFNTVNAIADGILATL